eukprot:6172128-Pleurochrysis_carterae.AAC.9
MQKGGSGRKVELLIARQLVQVKNDAPARTQGASSSQSAAQGGHGGGRTRVVSVTQAAGAARAARARAPRVQTTASGHDSSTKKERAQATTITSRVGAQAFTPLPQPADGKDARFNVLKRDVLHNQSPSSAPHKNAA